MNIALDTGWKIVIYYLSDTLEIHATRHNFCADHDPTLALTHAESGIIALFFR